MVVFGLLCFNEKSYDFEPDMTNFVIPDVFHLG